MGTLIPADLIPIDKVPPVAWVALGALAIMVFVHSVGKALTTGGAAYSSRFTSAAEATLGEMMIFMPASQLLTLKLAAACLGGLLGFGLGFGMTALWQRAIPVLFFALPAFFLPDIMIKMAYASRLKKFQMQMVDGMRIISNSLKAGLSFPDAIREMVRQLPDPIKGEFQVVLHQADMGLPLERGLENLSNRVPVDDLRLFVYSINTILSIGEGLNEICEKTAKLIQERFRVESRINTMTAEGKTQSVILCSAPFVLMLILFFVDPSLVMVLFTTFRGMMILLIVLILNVMGFLVIRKITNIQV